MILPMSVDELRIGVSSTSSHHSKIHLATNYFCSTAHLHAASYNYLMFDQTKRPRLLRLLTLVIGSLYASASKNRPPSAAGLRWQIQSIAVDLLQ